MPADMDEPQPIARTNSGSIIIFDPVKQTLCIRKKRKLDGKRSLPDDIKLYVLRSLTCYIREESNGPIPSAEVEEPPRNLS